MNKGLLRLTVVAFLVLALGLPGLANPLTRPTLLGTHHKVASGHWLASYAGNQILENGGNAFDAGAAMVLAQSVLENNLFGFAGEAQTLIYSAADEKAYEIDGGMALPKGVDVEWFKKNDIVAIPGDGLLCAGVPAMLDAMVTLLDKWGTISFAEAAQYAYQYANDGFPMYNSVRDSIKNMEKRFKGEWPSSAEVYLPGGKVPDFGEIFYQKDLANTIKRLMATALGARMTAQLLVQASKHLLMPRLVPFDRQPAFRLQRSGFEQHCAPGIIESHAEVQHGLLHRAVRPRRAWREVAEHPIGLNSLVAGVSILTADGGEDQP
jgi:hypothetical protein